MRNILALDCTDRACSVAVRRDDEVRELFLDQQRTHARHLLGQINDLLQQAGLYKSDLEAVLWCQGPGSFTGLRIAAACVQGLSYGLNIPALGFSSLFALALRGAHLAPRARQIWVGLDAHMGEIYTATFVRSKGAPGLTCLQPDRLVSTDTYRLPDDCDLYLGSGLARLAIELPPNGRLEPECQIHAADLAGLDPDFTAAQLQQRGPEIEPIYLRNADAWKKIKVEER